MNSIDKLVELFREFPGIGPRQAKRFAYFLLSKQNGFLNELSQTISKLKQEIVSCSSCFRFFPKNASDEKRCSICRKQDRDSGALMVVSHDHDVDQIEKTGSFNGLYFVLGGSLPILEKEPEKRIRINELLSTIEKRVANGLSEIILALDANPEGENTEIFLKEKIAPLAKKHSIKVSVLGRGLSTGTELEYSDPDTIKNALKNRG